MVEGFWKIFFINESGLGSGVIVLENGIIRGGGSNYYYEGNYIVQNGVMDAVVTANHYFSDLNNIFGPLAKVKVKLSGEIDSNKFTLNGEAVDLGKAISVKVERIGDFSP